MNLGSKLNQIHMDLNPMEKEIRSGTVEISDDFLNKIVKITSQFNTMLLVHAEDPEICFKEIKREIIDKKNNNHHHNLSSASSSSSSKSNGNASLAIKHHLTKTPPVEKNNTD